MQPFEMPAPDISFEDSRLRARVELPSHLYKGAALGLAAALEHRSGARSYWALAHPKSNRPDFHARDCFIAQLP
jgi:hypothetical protein